MTNVSQFPSLLLVYMLIPCQTIMATHRSKNACRANFFPLKNEKNGKVTSCVLSYKNYYCLLI